MAKAAGTTTLKIIAASVWLAAGSMLLVRGWGMLQRAQEEQGAGLPALYVSLAVGLLIGLLKGRYVLSRTARRNVRRIEALQNPRPWNAFTPRFVIVIGLMIGFGVGLRSLAAQGYLGGFIVAGGLYVGIGAALVVSAWGYTWRRPAARVAIADALRRADETPQPAPIGVWMVNLGTPDSPTPRAVRRYLRQFLGDPRVVEVNRALWWFVLNVIILPFRSRSSAELYKKVWTAEGSPLLVQARRQCELLRTELGEGYQVALGMRYGNPSMRTALDELLAAGCERILLLPMFPQYSDSTTGSVYAEAYRLLNQLRQQPALQVVPPYYEDPDYVASLAARVAETLGDSSADHHVFCFHGIPESYVEKGDPYLDHCARTARALARELGLTDQGWSMVFQSRFGEEPWLQPYADEYVPALAETCPRVLITTPGFTADCLETIDEIGELLNEDFLRAGGRELLRVPALNEHPRWIQALTRLVRRARASQPDTRAESLTQELARSKSRS